MARTFFALLLLLALLGCTTEPKEILPSDVDASVTEARDDSLALAAAYAGQARITRSVRALYETEVAKATNLADAADDPAIWVHPKDPARSLVFGTNKTGGLAAYDLRGREVAYYPIGKVNNVDILTEVSLAGSNITLLGCSNRTDRSIDLFSVDPETGALTDVAAGPLLMDSLRIDDIYGFCLGRAGEDVFAVANGKNGVLHQFRLRDTAGRFALDLVRQIAFDTQTEGMVADNELGWLYVGEEARGIWRLPLAVKAEEALTQVQKKLVADLADHPDLAADLEGLALYKRPDGGGYLVASIQGNFTYAVFDRSYQYAYRGSFKIVRGSVDGVEETDGIEITSTSLPSFPGGLLVVQDGFNYDGDTLRPQNFKYVNFGDVLDLGW